MLTRIPEFSPTEPKGRLSRRITVDRIVLLRDHFNSNRQQWFDRIHQCQRPGDHGLRTAWCPDELAGIPSGTGIRLNWNPATDNAAVGSYQLERQTPPSTNFVVVATPSTTTYTDSGLVPGTTYSYRVLAIDFSGNPGHTQTWPR